MVGLTEMFPESVRSFTSKSATKSWRLMKKTYTVCRNFGWIIASVAVISVVPVLFEIERDRMLVEEANQQRKLMFGPQSEGSFPIPPTIRSV